MSIIRALSYKGYLDFAPDWFGDSIMYETIAGSNSYGTAIDNSDIDLYGFCIPPKHILFPHSAGHISGFGKQPEAFERLTKEGVEVLDGVKPLKYDLAMFSIVRYIKLCFDNNPNMIDSLFTAEDCRLEVSEIGQKVLNARHQFLSKVCYRNFKDYAMSQLYKVENKEGRTGKRKDIIEKFGYDVKFASHCIRLLLECKQILLDENLDLRKHKDTVLEVKKGLLTQEDFVKLAMSLKAELEEDFPKSKLRDKPDEKLIKALLLDCLEDFYGNLDGCIVRSK